MLQIKLNTTKLINDSGDKILLNDFTGIYGEDVYLKDEATDTYALSSNTTGYGDPNLTREDIALFIIGEKIGSTSNTGVSFEEYSPTNASSFTAIPSGDGVYVFTLVYANSESFPDIADYTDGDVVYDPSNNILYKVEGEVMEVINKEDLLNTAYASEPVELIYLINAGTLYTELVAKSVELRRTGCSEKDVNMCVKAIDDIAHGIYAMEYEYAKGNKVNAATIAEYLSNKSYSNIK
jgi:hypothetical protein